MPIYEYECVDCGRLSEFIEGVSDRKTDRICGHCGGVSLRRVLSKGVTSRANGMMADRGGKTCCGREERCGKPPCNDAGSCCR